MLEAKKHMDKMKTILLRWLDILLISFLSFMIIFLSQELLIDHQSIDNWIEKFNHTNDIAQYSLYILTGIALQQTLNSIGDSTFKKFFKNPPLWTAAIASLICLFIFNHQFKLVKPNLENVLFLILVTVGLFLFPIIDKLRKLKRTPAKTNQTTNSPKSAPLINWLYNESPIEEYNSDKFNRDIIVDRIATRLNSDKTYNRGECLLGDYGSGKSSLINLVAEKLRLQKNDWLICKFDSWGRIENAKQAQALILEKMIESIGEHTSISALRNLPQNYLDALQGNDSWWNTLFSIFNASSLDPDVQLTKIDNILSAIDKKLLLVIEDLDRNTNCNKLSLEIVPLLDRLEKLTKVKFIITLGYEEHLSSAITRITSFREDLPKIKDEDLDFILMQFRGFCVNVIAHEDKYIDGVFDREFWPLINGKMNEQHRFNYSPSSIYFGAHEAIKYYLSNPRTLKYCLREVNFIWEKIHGEINFDDLLCLIIIKRTESVAFDFIIKNINSLVKYSNSFDGINKFKEELNSGIFKSKTHLTNLMYFLFPKLLHSMSADSQSQSRNLYLAPCLQSIYQNEKYLKNIVSTDVTPSEKEILNEIINAYSKETQPSLKIEDIYDTAFMIIHFKVAIIRNTNEIFTSDVYKKVIDMLCVAIESQPGMYYALKEILSPKTLNGLFDKNSQENVIKDTISDLMTRSIEDASSMLYIIEMYPEMEGNLIDFTYHKLIESIPTLTYSQHYHHTFSICLIIKKIITFKDQYSIELFNWISNINDTPLSIHFFYTIYSLDEQHHFPLFKLESMVSFVEKCNTTDSDLNEITKNELSELKRLIYIQTSIPPDPDEEKQDEN